MFRNQQECVPIGKLTSDSVVKNPPADARDSGDVGLIPWVGKIPWRRIWQPTPIFLPEKFHGHGILLGYSPWGHKESDMTEQLRTYTAFFRVQHSYSYMTTGKTIALTIQTFMGKVMSLLLICCH